MNPTTDTALDVMHEWIKDCLEVERSNSPSNAEMYATSRATPALFEGAEDPYSDAENASSTHMDGMFVTKSTIHRLFVEIGSLVSSYDHIEDEMTPSRIVDEMDIQKVISDSSTAVSEGSVEAMIQECFERGEPQTFARGLYEIEMANRVVPFFALSQVVIEECTVQMLNSHLIESSYQDSNATMKFLHRSFSQPSREKLLQRTGIVDGDFRSNMADVRTTRNDIIHDLRDGEYFQDLSEISDNVLLAGEIMNEFEQWMEDEDVLEFRQWPE